MTRDSKISKRLIGLFLLGCTLFNYPLLSLFNLETTIFGIPLLYGYIFGTWSLLIGICALVTRVQPDHPEDHMKP